MNSIQPQQTSITLLNEVRLSLNHPASRHKIWLFIEGNDDLKVYSKFFVKDNVELRSTNGCCSLIEILDNADRKITSKIIAIKDADFDRLEHHSKKNSLFLTDCHDLEVMMLMNNHTIKNILIEFQKDISPDIVRSELWNQARFIGYVRWYNKKNNIELNFKGLPINKFYNGFTHIQEKDCLYEINRRSPNKKKEVKWEDINDFMNNNPLTDELLPELCNGHDCSKILAINLSSKSERYSYKEIQKYLRLSYTMSDFISTTLYNELREWGSMTNNNIMKDTL